MTENQPSTKFRPRRSCLYMPGSNARAMEKARTIDADVVILDLEDAVVPDAKAEARQAVCDAVLQKGFGHREVVLRINALDTDWGHDDLRQCAETQPDAILVPKVTSAQDIADIDAALNAAGAPPEMGLWVMIEMPLAILNIAEIAAASRNTRLTTFVMGTNDLAKEMRAVTTPDRLAFQTALQLSVAAARANNLTAIDGVFNDIADDQGLEDECRQGRILGFDGKSLIHPAQLEIANSIFSPDIAQIEQARDVIAAFADPANAGRGVLKVNGKMTEVLHLQEAERIVAIADTIENLPN